MCSLHFSEGSVVVEAELIFNSEESVPDVSNITNTLVQAASSNSSDFAALGVDTSNIVVERTPPPTPSSELCGRPTLSSRIVGGQDSAEGNWPWQASLQKNGQHFCGGSLINRQWILTAAHCFNSSDPSQITVHLGIKDLDVTGANEITRTVVQIILHPKYDDITNNNDIALLQMISLVTLSDYIIPVCLPRRNSVFHNGTDGWVTGWGDIGEGVSLPYPRALQEVDVPVIGNRQCDCLYGSGSITSNMICAGYAAEGKDSCQGDSGGPMVNQQNWVWIQSGVVSFGYGCDRPGFPGVYTRVSRYQAWIKSHISVDRPGFVKFSSTGVDDDSSFFCPTTPTYTSSPQSKFNSDVQKV
ncbi:serine protease 33-like [Engraulis encrasicolus]|uniref:serine protease 33-like n=1 Tax=Engraulis encrasicolus TaxID=184585 RepID=UPI002FCEEC27